MWWKILLIIFALIFLFLWQSIHIIVSFDGEFKLIAGLGLVRLNVLKLVDKFMNKPKKEKPKKEEKEKEKKEEEPKKEEAPKSNVFKEVIELRGFDGAIDLLSEFASLLAKFGHGLIKHFIIRKIAVEYSVCANDAAHTAIEFGAINAAIFPLLGEIATHAQLKKQDVNIYADYTGQLEKQAVYIHCSYRILALLAVALGALKDFLKIMKREKSINARIKARSAARREKVKLEAQTNS